MNKKIFQLRHSLHLTQQKFADKLGVSRGVIAQIETGRNNPSIDLLNKIKKVFDVDVSNEQSENHNENYNNDNIDYNKSYNNDYNKKYNNEKKSNPGRDFYIESLDNRERQLSVTKNTLEVLASILHESTDYQFQDFDKDVLGKLDKTIEKLYNLMINIDNEDWSIDILADADRLNRLSKILINNFIIEIKRKLPTASKSIKDLLMIISE